MTTAIVCSIGAKAESKRVGIINILYNLSKTVLVIVGVTIFHKIGTLDNLWDASQTAGTIANANSVFNLSCALLLLPLVGVFEKLSYVIVKDDTTAKGKYSEKLAALSPVFFDTPALALRSIYDVLRTMLEASIINIDKAMNLIYYYRPGIAAEIEKEEDNIDQMTDAASSYMLKLNPHLKDELHIKIIDQYYKDVTEFERLGDHAVNLMESAEQLSKDGNGLTEEAKKELDILEFEHKKEVDSLEYELKSDETERTIRLKERELEAKEKEDKDKFKHDLAHEGVKGGIKFALLAGAYVLEAKGVVLPGRLLQFINGLGK